MIGKKIYEIRCKKRMSKSQLAHLSGTAISNIYNIEKGVSKNPGWYTICKIAEALEVEITAFLE